MRDLTEMKLINQNHNACGTASLAMVINFLTDDNITWQDIDRDIRRGSHICACPRDIVDYARKKGLQAGQYNHRTLEDIKHFTKKGLPMIAYIDPSPEESWKLAWHWVVIIGTKEINEQQKIMINNPSPSYEKTEESPWDIFEKKWAHLKALRLKLGYDRYFIGVGTKEDTLPLERAEQLWAGNTTDKGLADILNGFAYILQCKPSGLLQLLRGIISFFVGGISLLTINIYWWFKNIFVNSS